MYQLVYALGWILTLLPFRVLYLVSDLLSMGCDACPDTYHGGVTEVFVGAGAQVHRGVENANVGADADDDKGVDLGTGIQPVVEPDADVGADRVLAKDDELLGKGEIVQGIDCLAFRRAPHAVGWEGGKFDGVGVVGVLEQEKMADSQVVGALEQVRHGGQDGCRARAGERPLVAKALEQILQRL